MKIIEKEELLEEVIIGQWKISAKYGIVASPEGKTLVLEPRLSKLMYLLGLNINSNVSRDYLIDNIWQETIVNEESLTRAVSDLRKLLSNHFDRTLQIDTIPKRGYKLDMQIGPKLYALKLKMNSSSSYAILVLVLFLMALLGFVSY